MEKKKSGKKPTYDVSILNKVTGQKGKVGAAWFNDNGRISIKLNPCVVLASDPNLVITLFPIDWDSDKRTGDKVPSLEDYDDTDYNKDDEDDIPF